MGKVINYRCYNYSRDLYLVDMTLDLNSGEINWLEMNVPQEDVEPDFWQSPLLVQYLTPDGNERLCEMFHTPSPSVKPCRAAFFLCKRGGKVLCTPYGDFPLSDTEEAPKRMKEIVIFNEDE